MGLKKFTILVLFFFIYRQTYSNERFICSQSNSSSSKLVTNLFVSDKKIFMSGSTGSGEYDIIENNINGILAVNYSQIGKEFGIESLLVDKIKYTFVFKSMISSNRENNLVEIKGKCRKS